MSEHYDALETRDPQMREREVLARLAVQVAHAKAASPAYAKLLAGVDPAQVNTRAALAALPVTRKSALAEEQKAARPFGGYAATAWGRAPHVFASPGGLYEPDGAGRDHWRTARGLYAAGFRPGDLVHNTFAYHLTPGGWIMDAGARALGCVVIAADPGNTEQQLEAIQYLKPVAYVGVPDYLKILLDKAGEAGKDASSFKKALVSGGALFPSLRAEYKQRGIDTYQCYATADLGVIAYESQALDGMIVDEGVIIEEGTPEHFFEAPEHERTKQFLSKIL